MSKQKYYAVWVGRKPGVYDSWEKCNAQIFGFPEAKFKAFNSRQAAEQALSNPYKQYFGRSVDESKFLTDEQVRKIGKPILDSIAVDGAWNTATGAAEYRGVYLKTGEEIFHQGPFENGTNNVMEFLAIVHGLAHCKKHQIAIPIYSDSRNAINWVKSKQARTKLERTASNQRIFELIERAIFWLNQNDFPNKILKWETKAWGENPADFGRK